MAFMNPAELTNNLKISEEEKKDNAQVITLTKHIVSLFHSFYHDGSYAGELRIRLLDYVVIGGDHSFLQLVMEKDCGNYTSIHNSTYKFYLEFSRKAPNSRNPIVRTLDFKQFGEKYEPAFKEENLTDLFNNCIDQNMLNIHSKDFFDREISIVAECEEGKTYTLGEEKCASIDCNKALSLTDAPFLFKDGTNPPIVNEFKLDTATFTGPKLCFADY